MDVLLEFGDQYFFTPYIYPSWWSKDNVWRQLLSLNIIVDFGATLFYLITATLNFIFIYDKRLLGHPLMFKNQPQKEIAHSLKSIPLIGFLTAVTFLLEVRGYSKLYNNVDDSKYGWYAIACSIVSFILVTDCLIYWIHRTLHHRRLYSRIHKSHHQWKIPTPFASHAFNPVDMFLQGLPYHLYVFLFPMQKFTYLLLYVGANMWTVSIHDGDFRVPEVLKPFINGAAHHVDHHLFYNYNYGQYFTLWDRIGGSYRSPSALKGTGPLDQVIKKLRLTHGRGFNTGEMECYEKERTD